MELEQTLQNEPSPPQRSGGFFSSFVVVLAALGIAGGLGYLYFQEQTLVKEIAEWESRIAKKEQNIEEFKNQELGGLVQAEQILARGKNYRIEWSQIMEDVFKLEKPGMMEFIQFSSDRNKKVTISGRVSNWESVQDLLVQVRNEEDYDYIRDPFITSLSRKTEKGEKDPYSNQNQTIERSEFRLIFDYVPSSSQPSQ